MHVQDACCIELKISSVPDNNGDFLKNVSGRYRYEFEEKRLKYIKEGRFRYKNKVNNGQIFRNNDGLWSVSNFIYNIL